MVQGPNPRLTQAPTMRPTWAVCLVGLWALLLSQKLGRVSFEHEENKEVN